MLDLRRELGNIEHFCNMDNFVKSAYVLCSEAWEDILEGCSKTLCLVYGSLGYMANMLTFTSLILRMSLGI